LETAAFLDNQTRKVPVVLSTIKTFYSPPLPHSDGPAAMIKPRYLVLTCLFTILSMLIPTPATAQDGEEKKKDESPGINPGMVSSLRLRGIGPAFMSGRIVDIAVDPEVPSTWYLATATVRTRPVALRLTQRTGSPFGWEPVRTTVSVRLAMATDFTSQSTADGRLRRSAWRTQNTLPKLLFIRKIRIRSSLRLRAPCGRPAATVVCTRQPTAARPGKRFLTSVRTLVSPI
jgi:hypothetical protein